jgi:hypothetical protein
MRPPCLLCGGTFGHHAYKEKHQVESLPLIYIRDAENAPILTGACALERLGMFYHMGAFDPFKAQETKGASFS